MHPGKMEEGLSSVSAGETEEGLSSVSVDPHSHPEGFLTQHIRVPAISHWQLFGAQGRAAYKRDLGVFVISPQLWPQTLQDSVHKKVPVGLEGSRGPRSKHMLSQNTV